MVCVRARKFVCVCECVWVCVCVRVRQPPIHMPERLCEGPVGLGIDVVRLDNGCYQVRKLQSGGAAQISGMLSCGGKGVARVGGR